LSLASLRLTCAPRAAAPLAPLLQLLPLDLIAWARRLQLWCIVAMSDLSMKFNKLRLKWGFLTARTHVTLAHTNSAISNCAILLRQCTGAVVAVAAATAAGSGGGDEGGDSPSCTRSCMATAAETRTAVPRVKLRQDCCVCKRCLTTRAWRRCREQIHAAFRRHEMRRVHSACAVLH
jgi:hypothetical protein